MKNRIKSVRQVAGLTQMQFAEKLGLSRNYIAMLEIGQREPADRTITDICREFGVDEVWLRTGTGDMFKPKSRRDEIDEYIGQISAGKRSDIETLLIELMAETSVEEWQALAETFKRIAEKMNKPE